MRRWERFTEWLHELQAIGYRTQVGVIDAQFHDTPQSRRRLFVIADLEAEPSFPRSSLRTKKTVASILGRGEPKDRPWAFTPVVTETRAEATLERAKTAIKALGADAEFIMVYYGTDAAGGFQTLDRPLRTITTLDRFAYVRPNGSGHEMRMLQPPELADSMGRPAHHKWHKAS